MIDASMYIVSAVFSVVALGLGLGGWSWSPLVFVVTCLSSLFASLWRYGYFEYKRQYDLGDSSALAAWGVMMVPILYAACFVACLLALLVPTLASEESSVTTTVLSLASFVAAFAGGLVLAQNLGRPAGGDIEEESESES